MSAAVVCAFVLALGTPLIWRLRGPLSPCPILALPALTFTCGFAFWSLAAGLGYVLELHLALVAVLAAAFALLSLFVPIPERAADSSTSFHFDRPQMAAMAPILIFAITAAAIGPHNTLSADTVHHLIYVENFSRAPWIGYDHFELSHTVPRDVLFSAYAGNAYHALVALPALLIEGGGEAAFRELNFCAALLLASALYGLTCRLAGSDHGAIAGFVAVSLIFVLFLSSRTLVFGKWTPTSLAYPNHMGAMAALAAMSITLLAMERFSSLWQRVVAGFLIASTIALHLQWFLYIIMIIGLFALFSLIARHDRLTYLRHNLPTALAAIIATAAIGHPRAMPYSRNVESLSGAGTPGSLPRFVVETPLGETVTPWVLTSTGCLIALISALLLIVLTRSAPARHLMDESRRLEIAVFASAIVTFALLIVTPVFSGFLMAIASPIVVGRMTMMLLAVGVVAAGVAASLLWAHRPSRIGKKQTDAIARPAFGIGLTALAIYAFQLSPWPSSLVYWEKQRTRLAERGYLPLEKVIDDPEVSRLLRSIPNDTRLLLLQPDYAKEVPLIRTGARMVQPVYSYDPPSRQAEADLAPLLAGTSSKAMLEKLYRQYGFDAALAWDWPEQSIDHFATMTHFHLKDEASIDRGNQPPVSLRLYEYKASDAVR